jgi:hypothetical protein
MDAVEAAADVPPEEARALLEERLADAPELLSRALQLLEGGQQGDDFLEPAPSLRPRAQAIGPGMRIGPYELESQLGAGGMGMVFLARQAEPERPVALKLMNPALVTGDALARFRLEVQALASLSHPNVAQVYETGIHAFGAGEITQDVPWFAMEYVDGARPIVRYAQDEGLSIEARLRLFARVCRAVHHGHQKGVLHRDLKPDNVLVDGGGRVKVIDFGVARMVDPERRLATMRTTRGEVVGTVPYMSPEQIVGSRPGEDVRSDVYALGVLLFELLTGQLPISEPSGELLSWIRRVAEEPPKRLSAVRPACRGDLDVIAQHALEKDPARRYPSADALGADVERYLAREPILARPPTLGYQLRMFARRHAAVVGAAALVFVVAIVAALVSIHYAIDARVAEQQAEARADEADAERRRAEALVEAMLGRGLRTTSRLAPRFHQLPGGAKATQELMAATLEDLRFVEAQAGDDRRARLALAEAYVELGGIQGNPNEPNVRDYKGAVESYDHAIEIAS